MLPAILPTRLQLAPQGAALRGDGERQVGERLGRGWGEVGRFQRSKARASKQPKRAAEGGEMEALTSHAGECGGTAVAAKSGATITGATHRGSRDTY